MTGAARYLGGPLLRRAVELAAENRGQFSASTAVSFAVFES